MESRASASGKFQWTVTVESSADHLEKVKQIIEQFGNELEAAGATWSVTRVTQMAAGQQASLERAAAMMRQQGLPEAQIERTRAHIAAQMGEGSWDEVVAAAENELETYHAGSKRAEEAALLLNLVEYTMNAGNRSKAIDYFRQAERMFAALEPNWLWPGQSDKISPEAASRAGKMYRLQLERLRNWLFSG